MPDSTMGRKIKNIYRVEVIDGGCSDCGHGKQWSVVHNDGHEDIEESTVYGNEEDAESIRDSLNEAHAQGVRNAVYAVTSALTGLPSYGLIGGDINDPMISRASALRLIQGVSA